MSRGAPKRPVRSLAWTRSSGAGGSGPEVQVLNPEQCKVASASHSGNKFRHQRVWVPPNCRIQPPPARREPIPGDDHLLFLALYRDKVAQAVKQQEEVAAAQASVSCTASAAKQRKGEGTSARRHKENVSVVSARSASAGPPAGAMNFPGGAMNSTRASRSASEAHHPTVSVIETPVGASGSEPTEAAVLAGFASLATPRRAGQSEKSCMESASAAHVASVSTRAATGGVISEYLEAKQLGKLYDQWRASQESEVPVLSSARERSVRITNTSLGGRGVSGVSTARNLRPVSVAGHVSSPRGIAAAATPRGVSVETGGGRSGAGSVVPMAASTSAEPLDSEDTPTPSVGRAGETGGGTRSSCSSTSARGANSRADQLRQVPTIHRDATIETIHHPFLSEEGDEEGGEVNWVSHVSEEPTPPRQRLLTKAERMHRVITNPKARVENFAERGNQDRDRPLPTHIEGFPQLSLLSSHWQGL